ncbi:MAG: PIG-L deacetylase family protein [Acidobacteriota bacterium]
MGDLVFAPHPDDETIGMGARLAALHDPWIVHVTEGAPRDMTDARAHGFRTREQYAGARRRELLAALDVAGIGPERTRSLGVGDQEASHDLAGLALRIADLLRELRPDTVYAPPYEGGHPDHDATAFAVHAACRLVGRAPAIREYALYHCRGGSMAVCEFLPYDGCPVETIELTPAQSEAKRRMLDCFRTQRETLRAFGTAVERSRPAPDYNFCHPPRAGCIYYDTFPWGISSWCWLEKARAALARL